MAIAIELRPQNFAAPSAGTWRDRRVVMRPPSRDMSSTSARAVSPPIELGRAVLAMRLRVGGKFRLMERISRLKHFAVFKKSGG